MDKLFGNSSSERSVIYQLFVDGPTWDGDIVSKYGRGKLVESGLVDRLHGYSYLTEAGMRYAMENMALGDIKQYRQRDKKPEPPRRDYA